MSKEKQIEEMVAVVRDNTEACKTCSWYKEGLCIEDCELEEDNQKICTDLYNAGYRKQSEGEWYVNYMMSNTPSKRGRVIHYKTCTCSVCGKRNGRSKTNYCPNCGAKMEGGAE